MSRSPPAACAVGLNAYACAGVAVVAGVPPAEAVRALRDRGMSVLAADGAGATDLDDAEDDGPHRSGPRKDRTLGSSRSSDGRARASASATSRPGR